MQLLFINGDGNQGVDKDAAIAQLQYHEFLKGWTE